ncbi:hypothetical protein Tdes44962_MAKER03805 [Teratosphaeria destructans]|uniref:Uncharacterized protein n=1 Tax=Teratosphaeria destructans TaxID=418781 RepID=A0A9W7SP15_9PEZI|nr:hypothetical protein Tdes44962_MAKER03805 [Teratosphaeria destructans]
MASSPSKFLTFYCRAATSSSLRNTLRTHSRSFAATARGHNVLSDKGTQQDTGPGQKTGGSREHALDKEDKKDPNLQSAESSFGRDARQQDTGGHATRQKDERNSTAKAKRDHPEAPDVVIGMQDERGGKGL